MKKSQSKKLSSTVKSASQSQPKKGSIQKLSASSQKPSSEKPSPILHTSGAVLPEPRPKSLNARSDARKAFGKH